MTFLEWLNQTDDEELERVFRDAKKSVCHMGAIYRMITAERRIRESKNQNWSLYEMELNKKITSSRDIKMESEIRINSKRN